MRERTVCAMALGPSENMQGGIRCFSLATSQILRRGFNDITQTKWTEERLRRMHYINKKQKSVNGLLFGDHQGDIEFSTFGNSDPGEDALTESDAFDYDVYNPHGRNDAESVDEIDAVDDDSYTPSNQEDEDYLEEDYINESTEEGLVTTEDNANDLPDKMNLKMNQ